jgi:hypothetical protein
MNRCREILKRFGIDAGAENIGGYENYTPYFVRITFGTSTNLPPFVLKGKEAEDFNIAFILDGWDINDKRRAEEVKRVLTQAEIDEVHKWATPWEGFR